MKSLHGGSRISGYYNLPLEERIAVLRERSGLDANEIAALCTSDGFSAAQADNMVENAVGVYSLPLGIALNFLINRREVLIPMAIEEPSVVAGASYMAKLVRAGGGFNAHVSSTEMIGQIQVLNLADVHAARLAILERKEELLEKVSAIDPVLKKLGGGGRDLEVRIIPASPIGAFLVVHLIYDVRDAMGANAVNTACERLAHEIEDISGGKVLLRILSNLADRRIARARCTVPLDVLGFDEFAPQDVRDGVIAAWAFAASDPYRAATHNKGIMNGIDAVVIASGNDWRAVEAGAHAYAARSGRYTSLSTWGSDTNGNLVGTLELPLALGIVGGATRVHPAARAAIKLMGVESASDLAEIAVSVGLAQNLAALRALVTEGIQRGHMTLHARQVAMAAGAEGDAITVIAQRMVAEKAVRIDRAQELLAEWKAQTN